MVWPEQLKRLLPDAPDALFDLFGALGHGLEPPIRSELFGRERFAQHGHSLGDTHGTALIATSSATFSPRLKHNIASLRSAQQYVAVQAATGYDISPAAEWLLDNFHLIEAQLEEIRSGLPRRYFRSLPVLRDPPLAGLPRIYGVAWAIVAHTDSGFDEDLLLHFLSAYQERCELTLGELWALPTTLRVVLVENLRRLAERVAANKAAREVANVCCDRLGTLTPTGLDDILELLRPLGVERVFLGQMAQRLKDYRPDGQIPALTSSTQPVLSWLRHALPDPVALQRQQRADQTADNLSVSNAVTSLRAIGDSNWPDLVSRTSRLIRLMLTSQVFEAEHPGTRDQTLHRIEKLSRRSGRSEVQVAQALLDLMAATPPLPDPSITHAPAITTAPGYWLHGSGQGVFLRGQLQNSKLPQC